MIKLAVSTALVVLLAGPAAYAWQEPDKEKPAQQEEKKQEPERKPEEKQPQEKPQQEKQTKEQNEHTKQTDKERQDAAKQQAAAKQQQQTEKERVQQNKTAQDQHQVQQAPRENAANHNNARRIKDEDFRAHFGRQHEFRVARRDDRRFNYGGYWFTYSDPWPPEWSYSDEVYVDEIDGEYYLIDPVHPGLRLLVIVSS
jgi:outer membrane biosynthesis protein TonB